MFARVHGLWTSDAINCSLFLQESESAFRLLIRGCDQSKKNQTSRMIAKFLFSALSLLAATTFAANWPAWRNDGTGISPEKNVPVKWSKTENVRWRTPLPDRGNSSPIVW